MCQIILDKTEDANAIEAICGRLGYEAILKIEDAEGTITETPNPESNIDFATRKIYEYVKNEMEAYFGDKLRTDAQPAEKVIVEEKIDAIKQSMEAISVAPVEDIIIK